MTKSSFLLSSAAMHHGKKKTFFLHITEWNRVGPWERKWTGSRNGKKKKIPPRALKTGGAAELMGERRQAFSARGYYVYNGDAVRVGGFWGERGKWKLLSGRGPNTAVLQEGDEGLR